MLIINQLKNHVDNKFYHNLAYYVHFALINAIIEIMNKIVDLIIKKASWKKAAALSALFAAFFLFINRSGAGVAGLLTISGGANVLDFEFGYSQSKAYQMLTAMGPEGRLFYLTKLLPLDFPFPFVYMLFFGGWIAFLLKRVARADVFRDWHKFLLLTPVFTMAFDWAENAGVIAMLNGYPDLPAWAVLLASVAGMLKTIFLIANILVIAMLAIVIASNRMRYFWQQ